ncbi:MAG: SMC-Scp complex subunit ScpB [Candidatus Micrarchaeota archaeon]|nr:SMC-Scp complex subunit ScpB [Candidatus Micrarchaeota archaeon]
MEDSENERIIEAALFISSRPLSLQELGKLIGVAAPGFVEQRLKNLQEDYNNIKSSIEIAEEGGKYFMRLRSQYVRYVKDFAQAAELSKHALRTLAYIAKSEGITKHQLFLKIGGGIYDDVNELLEKDFITQKKAGRTKSLTTTAKFRSYFQEAAKLEGQQ